MPKPFAPHEKTLIAARLLEQGRRQFAAFGLRKTTVAELAAAAGISKGAFYLFYPSKEALFMDVAEDAEQRFRQAVLATVNRPGPSPRARLFAVLHTALTLWRTIPVLQLFTRSDFELLAARVPAAQLEAHLRSDRVFVEELIAACRRAGIPIQAQPDQLDGLLHVLFFTSLHADDLGPGALTPTFTLLLELIAAFCLGEVTVLPQTVLPQTAPAGAPLRPSA
jgi:AcrR family transcriptional regulator